MNSDYEKRALIETNALEWESTQDPGVYIKLLSLKENERTALIKLDPNASYAKNPQKNSVEIFVLQGVYWNEFGRFEEGTYLNLPNEDESLITTEEGCIIFRKTSSVASQEPKIVQTSSSLWLQGQGNLQVLPLHEHTALVKWPQNERFLPHKHWGGEEILVLSGIFMDEHGSYPEGTWIRSPHLSQHYPFVEQETIIWVKTGHL